MIEFKEKSQFLYTVCQNGAEKVLKEEILKNHEELRFAYSRPGFVTFKHTETEGFDTRFVLDSIFAREYGISIGKIGSKKEPASLAFVADEIQKLLKTIPEKYSVHVFEREFHAIGSEPKDYTPFVHVDELQKILGVKKSKLAENDLVFDVIEVEEGEWWIGLHRHSDSHTGFSGGNPRIELPESAPSRAYLKIEEALLLSKSKLQTGQVALEIGSAPGGACYALLNRGLMVTGIDPGAMAPSILSHKNFRHVKMQVWDCVRDDLPAKVDWLLLDINLTPEVTLGAVEKILNILRDEPKGLFLTVKLPDWSKVQELPQLIKKIRRFGYDNVFCRQLASNKQEVFVFAG